MGYQVIFQDEGLHVMLTRQVIPADPPQEPVAVHEVCGRTRDIIWNTRRFGTVDNGLSFPSPTGAFRRTRHDHAQTTDQFYCERKQHDNAEASVTEEIHRHSNEMGRHRKAFVSRPLSR